MKSPVFCYGVRKDTFSAPPTRQKKVFFHSPGWKGAPADLLLAWLACLLLQRPLVLVCSKRRLIFFIPVGGKTRLFRAAAGTKKCFSYHRRPKSIFSYRLMRSPKISQIFFCTQSKKHFGLNTFREGVAHSKKKASNWGLVRALKSKKIPSRLRLWLSLFWKHMSRKSLFWWR